MRVLRRASFVVLLVYWAALFVLTHTPVERLPDTRVNDKLAHLLAYALLATLIIVWRWLGTRDAARSGMVALTLCLVYGVIDELLQIPVGRDCELLDWMADASGAASAVVVCGWVLARFSYSGAGPRT